MKVVKALLVWLISIPLYTIAWLLSIFSFVFVMPIKQYNRVLYGIPKIKVKSITKEELLNMLKNDISNEKKDNDKNINDKDKVS